MIIAFPRPTQAEPHVADQQPTVPRRRDSQKRRQRHHQQDQHIRSEEELAQSHCALSVHQHGSDDACGESSQD